MGQPLQGSNLDRVGGEYAPSAPPPAVREMTVPTSAGQPTATQGFQEAVQKHPLTRGSASLNLPKVADAPVAKKPGKLASLMAGFTKFVQRRRKSVAKAPVVATAVAAPAAQAPQVPQATDLLQMRTAYVKGSDQIKVLEQRFNQVKEPLKERLHATETCQHIENEQLLINLEIDRRVFEDPGIKETDRSPDLQQAIQANRQEMVEVQRDVLAGNCLLAIISDSSATGPGENFPQQVAELNQYIGQGYALSPEGARFVEQNRQFAGITNTKPDRRSMTSTAYDIESLSHMPEKSLKELQIDRAKASYNALGQLSDAKKLVNETQSERDQLRTTLKKEKTNDRLAHLDLALREASLLPEKSGQERSERDQILNVLQINLEAEEIIQKFQQLQEDERQLLSTEPQSQDLLDKHKAIKEDLSQGKEALQNVLSQLQMQTIPAGSAALVNTQNHIDHTKARLQLLLTDPKDSGRFVAALMHAESQSKPDLNAS